jgi:hypothetical protein
MLIEQLIDTPQISNTHQQYEPIATAIKACIPQVHHFANQTPDFQDPNKQST